MRYLAYYVCIFLITTVEFTSPTKEDFYQLLGIARDATVKEIRRAFKALAIKLHPDKNKADKNAEASFIKVTKAYEILRDPTKRKHYDVHGDKEFDNFNRQYHSYAYYRDQFGIYDDDPLIVTLSKNDYEVNVLDDSQPWFVNFYSSHCHHCHELAPTWRQLAQDLEGVVRFAAVNCEDDYPLCYSLSITGYPTLLYYEKEAHMYEGVEYEGKRSLEALKKFVMSRIKVTIKDVSRNERTLLDNQNWLLILCDQENSNCPNVDTQTKIAATLEGLIPVATIKETSLANDVFQNHTSTPVVLWHIEDGVKKVDSIEGSDHKEIVDKVLEHLPNPRTLDDKDFAKIRRKLKSDVAAVPWIICFYLGTARDLNLQLKRLPTLVTDINIGLVHCGRSSQLCSDLHISRYPTWGVLKKGGAIEMHHGRDVLHEVAAFARDGSKSTNLHALGPSEIHKIKKEGSAWLIDWYAPWCPPCKNLLPEFRKSSQKFSSDKIQFGTVDCTLHKSLCSKEHINSYPSLQLINGSHVHKFHGMLSEPSITEFVEDHLNPVVIELDEHSFISLERKPVEELWIVDFFAPWCGPCQKLAPEWRRLAKSVAQFHEIKVAHVDCVSYHGICDSQNIASYPTIRLYPLGSIGLSTVAIYNGNRDMVSIKRWLLHFIPSTIETFSETEFKEQVLTQKYYLPWLVDFFAPWCGHCVHFEPEFRSVAKRLEGRVRCAKVDCQSDRIFCGHQRVTGFPTVRLYLSPTEFHNIESQDATEITRKVKELVKEYKERSLHDEL